jgi:hypothetical protein
MALQAYVDGSGTGLEEFVLAGYIATPEKWAAFSKEWEKILSTIKADAFKANRQHRSKARRDKTGQFYKVIENHVNLAFSCMISRTDLEEAVESIDWPANFVNVDRLKNPYFFGFKAVINVLLQLSNNLNIREPVDFIFDEENEKQHTLKHWELIKKSSSINVSNLMGVLSYGDDKKTLPLQAADLYAYWIRKWIVEHPNQKIEESDFPWKVNVEMQTLHITFTKEDLIKELSRRLPKNAVMGVRSSDD